VRFVGIDLGATRIHVARLDGDRVDVGVTTEIGQVVEWSVDATAIAIDAPSDPATGRVHAGAHSKKFAVARCNEIAAGEQLGIWVPWVTPVLADAPGWMRTGFAVWAALRAAGHEPVEVYPAGCFWLLNGRRWPPKKSTPQGRAARRALLGLDAVLPTHDHIDAAMAAVVARGPYRLVGHDEPGCDGSRLAVLEIDGRPGGEGDVGHAEVIDDAPRRPEAVEARADGVGAAGVDGVLGH
jgi:predicted nuclease with RNAse H fold